MNIISVKQLREQFPAISRGIRQGKRYLLIYRSKPLAEIRPVHEEPDLTEKEEQDQIRKNVALVKKLAGGFHTKINVTPEELNKYIDKEYDKEVDKMLR